MITILYFYSLLHLLPLYFFFFFNDTATTEIYTLSLHDALPIWSTIQARSCTSSGQMSLSLVSQSRSIAIASLLRFLLKVAIDRKSTRLNSSHMSISYAVFCLKKKKKIKAT